MLYEVSPVHDSPAELTRERINTINYPTIKDMANVKSSDIFSLATCLNFQFIYGHHLDCQLSFKYNVYDILITLIDLLIYPSSKLRYINIIMFADIQPLEFSYWITCTYELPVQRSPCFGSLWV